jgi:sec-independent protein translocase protein TatA
MIEVDPLDHPTESFMIAACPSLMLALFGGLGPWEIALILLAVLLLFGGRKLPDLARNLARGFKSFKRELSDVQDHLKDDPKTGPDESASDDSSDPYEQEDKKA